MMGKLFSIWLLEMVVNLYDFVTLPLYYLVQQPWRVRHEATRIRARQVDNFVWANVDNKLDKSNRKSTDTLDQLFRESVATYATRKCLGIRKILSVEYKESTANGLALAQNGTLTGNAEKVEKLKQQQQEPHQCNQVISKYILDDKYTWFTYKQIERIVIKLSVGLINKCIKAIHCNSDNTDKILICADTCIQWFLIAHACFRNNITVVTAYTTLEDEAILHIIHQTEVKLLVVSQKFASRVSKLVEQCPLVETIILLDEPLPGQPDQLIELKNAILDKTNVKQVMCYNELISEGENKEERILSVPTGSDIAVLMYTSGSTGKAKGVMLNHKCIVYTALAFSGPGDISHTDRYIGYLPLGHVLELAAECIFLRNGSTIAYSSPFTLTDTSPMIKRGQRGDSCIIKPTIMGAVPLVLDRIKSGCQQAIKSKGAFYDQLLNDFVIRYKRYWWERYYDTPIMNRVLCKRFNMILGGEIRAICSGGAALSRETQEYLRHVCNYTVLQGYGLTETSAAASFCDIDDRRYNIVGAPYPVVNIKLESWSDYSVHDKPFPRGEIIVGGQPVSAGYYKMDELTRESFYVDPKTGMRYFRTGDIGLVLPDGVLKIIDRKKDIVKPLSGEYISLSEIETALKTNPLVENICVYCSQFSNYIVAIVKPYPEELRILAKQLYDSKMDAGKKFRQSLQKTYKIRDECGSIDDFFSGKSVIDKLDLKTLCSNIWLTEHSLHLLQLDGKRKKLKRTQIPSKITLSYEDWTPESGFVTASFKLKRREIERFYAKDIKQLYTELGQNIDQDL